MKRWAGSVAVLAAVGAVVAGVLLYPSAQASPGRQSTANAETVSAPVTPAADETLVGAGDIAECGSEGDEATADLLDGIEGTVFTAGDNAYSNGSEEDFAECYEPSWGRHKARTRPAIGNHEYNTDDASGYFGYFGESAGEPGKGYYSYDLGDWHVVVVNSNCDEVEGCDAGSPQEQWLREDLAASTKACTAAIWHHPLFTSSDHHGPSEEMEPIYQALYDANAEVVLVGHNHQYERFAPQDPAGQLDEARGIRQFVVGMGGADLYGFDDPEPNSEVRNDDTHGVMKLSLHSNSYDWEFVPAAGGTFTDTGSGTCH